MRVSGGQKSCIHFWHSLAQSLPFALSLSISCASSNISIIDVIQFITAVAPHIIVDEVDITFFGSGSLTLPCSACFSLSLSLVLISMQTWFAKCFPFFQLDIYQCILSSCNFGPMIIRIYICCPMEIHVSKGFVQFNSFNR